MTDKKDALTQTRWSLTDLFSAPDSPEFESAFKYLEDCAASFEKFRAQLSETIDTDVFITIIEKLEEIYTLSNNVSSFAHLLYSEDTQNQSAQNLLVRVEQFSAGLSNRLLFFSLWWKELSDENADRLMEKSGDYRYWLEEIRHFKDFTLSEKEEQIINIKNVTGSSAMNLVYSTLTNRYLFTLDVEGEERQLTRGELSTYARHENPDLRARAYQELYRVYGDDGSVLGLIYQTLVRDWQNENIDLRGFTSPIAARNLANDIPDHIIDTLLDVCQRNNHIFQRFFNLKAKWIGMEKLRRYDIYAPVSKSNRQYSYAHAYEMVMDSFRNFDAEFASLAANVFDRQHVDSEVRKGKRSGAFCLSASPQLIPWVLLNYQGKAEDVATMAHELGHAIHSMLASHHSIFTFQACLPLAETASTFAEMMLVDNLLSMENDDEVRRDVLFRQVDDSYATIMRQAYFALFEKNAHEMIQLGASVDDVCAAYMENLQNQFGGAVDVSDEFRWEWVSIPHIFNVPFYVYAYAFGQLLVLSLYQQYKMEGEAFKPRYRHILASGGSQAPTQLLANAGIDISQDAFWQGGFNLIDTLVKQLEAIPLRRSSSDG